jgi:hypothetical protein
MRKAKGRSANAGIKPAKLFLSTAVANGCEHKSRVPARIIYITIYRIKMLKFYFKNKHRTLSKALFFAIHHIIRNALQTFTELKQGSLLTGLADGKRRLRA